MHPEQSFLHRIQNQNAELAALVVEDFLRTQDEFPLSNLPVDGAYKLVVHSIASVSQEHGPFGYAYVPLFGVYNVLDFNAGKFDKTELCKKIDTYLVETHKWPILTMQTFWPEPVKK